MTEKGLLPREQAILTEIVEYYISHHEAVSARTLSKFSELSLSPTSIRNLMKDLSEAGYLTHQGAVRGRLPTRKAFYIYINGVCGKALRLPAHTPEPPAADEGAPALADTLRRIGAHLAEESGFAAVASLPARQYYPLDWVRLSSVGATRVLVSVGTLFGDVWSKVVESPDPFPPQTLADVEAFLNRTYRGRTVEFIRNEIMSGEPKSLLADAPSLGAAFRVLRKAFDWGGAPHWLVWGEDALLQVKELHTPETMLCLHRVLHDSSLIARAAENGRVVEGGLVAIGKAIGFSGLERVVLVAFPFGWDENHPCMIAVLGPMHMNYQQVVRLVAGGAENLNRVVTSSLSSRTRQPSEPAGASISSE